MLLGDVLVALILGTLFTTIFVIMARSRHGLPSAIPVFILFFLFAWAGGLWLRPVGPPLFGMYWIPGLILVTLVFLVLAALARRPMQRVKEDITGNNQVEYLAAAVVGAVFWLLVGVLLVAVVIGYLL